MDETLNHFGEHQIIISRREDWSTGELDNLYNFMGILARRLGGWEIFANHIGKVTIEKTDVGSVSALAYVDRIKLSTKFAFSAWTVIHELSHVWDAKNNWSLSRALEKFTGGFTNSLISKTRRLIPGAWDAGTLRAEPKPGRYGRKPGCNAAGYFYRDKPSGSNWNFNLKEDFAESVVMYCGWGQGNELSKAAHGRIERYLLPNGTKDPIYGIADNWTDYARYFYPEGGDYTKTRRWQFIDELIHNKIQIK